MQSQVALDRLEDALYQANLEAVTASLTSNEDSTKWLALRSLIVSTLVKDPRDRPTISEVVDELQAVSAEEVKQDNIGFFLAYAVASAKAGNGNGGCGQESDHAPYLGRTSGLGASAMLRKTDAHHD